MLNRSGLPAHLFSAVREKYAHARARVQSRALASGPVASDPEEGSIAPLIVGMLALLLLIGSATVAITGAYLQTQHLQDMADAQANSITRMIRTPEEASGAAEVDEAAAAEAAQSIQTLAAYTLAEAQIENMITAKGYTDCVVFMADDGVSVVVSAGEDGLQTEDIAKITDIVKQETELTADCIKILEVN